ncbi:hypothetical protein O6H91_Y104500 [Diphasiastrum complanatum]|nr:hypothetical protein O6H91_Y104500 [Diphasiastrum complanatum]
MAKPSASSTNSFGLKVVLVLLALGLGFYIVGPSLYWELTDSIAAASIPAPVRLAPVIALLKTQSIPFLVSSYQFSSSFPVRQMLPGHIYYHPQKIQDSLD